MTDEEYDFVRRVGHRLPLKLADRKEDKVRQKCRKAGWVEVLKNPRRWSITNSGLEQLYRHPDKTGSTSASR